VGRKLAELRGEDTVLVASRLERSVNQLFAKAL
jgi:hypothetical protein